MLRAMEPLDREIKKIDIRRKQEEKKRELEGDLVLARNAEAEQELISLKNELDQTQKTKNIIETKVTEASVRKINIYVH
jgi:chromosome segregation ATPase